MERSHMEVFKGSELSLDELQAVTGGRGSRRTGAGLALGYALGGIAVGVAVGGVVGMLGIGVAALGGLSYAYDAYSSYGYGGDSF